VCVRVCAALRDTDEQRCEGVRAQTSVSARFAHECGGNAASRCDAQHARDVQA